MTRPGPEIAVLLPAEERFDGSGGAVASWVRFVYSDLAQRKSAIIACPRASPKFADGLTVISPRLYGVYDRGIEILAKAAGRVLGKKWWGAYQRALLDGRPWLASVYPRIRDAETIHVHNRPRFAIWLRGVGYRGTIILHMHNSLHNYARASEIADLQRAVDGFAFCSGFLAAEAEKRLGLPHGTVIYNCADRQGAIDGPGRAPRSLAYAGRIIPEKGPLEAVQICARLNKETGERWVLQVFGGSGSGTVEYENDYLRQVRAEAKQANVDFGDGTVELRGYVDRQELLEALARTAYFVYPCHWEEPFGMVLLDAYQAGAVPIASAKGGIPEVIENGLSGILVDDSIVVDDMTAALIELDGDPQRLAAMRARGQRLIKDKFSPSATARNLERLIQYSSRG